MIAYVTYQLMEIVVDGQIEASQGQRIGDRPNPQKWQARAGTVNARIPGLPKERLYLGVSRAARACVDNTANTETHDDWSIRKSLEPKS